MSLFISNLKLGPNILAVSSLVILFFTLFFSCPVLATTVISPLLELEADPGQTQPAVVKIYNETDQNLFLVPSIEKFKAGDEAGQPVYLPPEEKDEFLNWFNLSQDSILLKPKQAAIVPFTVVVPPQAIPGGYYAVIFWENQVEPTQEKPAVTIKSKVGTLIFLKVKGELVEQGQLLEFKIQGDQNYFWHLPINFIIRFNNSGNIHLQPTGTIELKNWLGQKEVLPVNKELRNVLPQSTRRFEIIWGSPLVYPNIIQQFWGNLKEELNHFTFGRYSASLNLTYGSDSQQAVTQELSFWFIPVSSIIALIIIFFVLIILIKINSRVKKLKQETKKLPNEKRK
ncbi:MAG: hypothetical protein WC675_03230 [Patescibacteria group bacterium]|jgi:hypothetical protein